MFLNRLWNGTSFSSIYVIRFNGKVIQINVNRSWSLECLIADIRLTDTWCLAIAKSRREKWDELKVKLDKSWKINLGNNCEEVRLATGYSCVSIYLIVFTNSIRNNLKIFTQIQSVENCSTAGDSIYFEASPASH